MHLCQLVRRRNIFAAFLLICGYLLVMNMLESSQDVVDNREKIHMIEESIRSLANQGPCKLPNLELNPPELMGFYKDEDPIICDPEESDWVKCDKSLCYIKQTVIHKEGKVTCDFRDIIRVDDFHYKFGSPTRSTNSYTLKESDFVRAKCWSESGYHWDGKLFGIREGVAPNRKLWNTEPKFNVLIFGFDSLSRLAFMRKLPKTHEFLTEELGGHVLEGYNIVGDGTPQALIPILTGFTELELPETRRRKKNSEYVNVFPFIWKEYQEYGYVTSFNEDVPSIGTFSYRLNGFKEQPTYHYQRLYYLAIEDDLRTFKRLCVGSKPRHQVMLDYTKQFMQKYTDAPRFVFSFHGELSHDSINLIGLADDDTRQFLRELKDSGVLDDTILIFMADHGNRFADIRNTLQGKQEERLPFFSFVFPHKFKELYKNEYTNFKSNIKRLVTPFDVHATLQDILRLQSTKTIQKPFESRAISLFKKIPHDRSCADAYIEPHWCACLNWRQINASEEDVIRASTAIIDRMNAYTQSFRTLCTVLELREILWAAKLLPHTNLIKFKKNRDADGYLADLSSDTKVANEMYQVKIVTKQGGGIFEGSVVHNLQTNVFEVKISDISRVNMYGDQAHCILELNPELRKFCYCK